MARAAAASSPGTMSASPRPSRCSTTFTPLGSRCCPTSSHGFSPPTPPTRSSPSAPVSSSAPRATRRSSASFGPEARARVRRARTWTFCRRVATSGGWSSWLPPSSSTAPTARGTTTTSSRSTTTTRAAATARPRAARAARAARVARAVRLGCWGGRCRRCSWRARRVTRCCARGRTRGHLSSRARAAWARSGTPLRRGAETTSAAGRRCGITSRWVSRSPCAAGRASATTPVASPAPSRRRSSSCDGCRIACSPPAS
mmetsp:Transcript_51919/g.143828  ORF Transcript_51919/g.143828 Transcript_51919/m.143828 type:complete len:258 (-) Transcript_51919:626-1399(-)